MDRQQHFIDLLHKFDNAMLITHDAQGQMHARPLAIADSTDEGTLFFATDRHSPKVQEVLRDSQVAVTLQSGSHFLAISGRATLTDDARLKEEMESAAWKPFFPKGAEDPALTLLKVMPESGEYWNRSGGQRLQYLWKAGKAVLQGERLEDSEQSEKAHAKVNL